MTETGAERPYTLTDEVRNILNSVSTATITSQLQRRGLTNCFLNGLRATQPGKRLIGYAHTVRYVALREDLAKQAGMLNAQRRGVEGIQPDEVLVIEARNEPHAGTIGDIFVMRVKALGGAGVITDGALRDTPAIKGIDLPVYHQASHAATLGKLHVPWDTQCVITCAGVAIVPGDVLVGDDEGVVVIPAALVDEVAQASHTMEIEEAWAIERVAAGESSIGTFPIAADRRPEYEAWLKAKG